MCILSSLISVLISILISIFILLLIPPWFTWLFGGFVNDLIRSLDCFIWSFTLEISCVNCSLNISNSSSILVSIVSVLPVAWISFATNSDFSRCRMSILLFSRVLLCLP